MTKDLLMNDTDLNLYLDALKVPDCPDLEQKIGMFVKRRATDRFFLVFVHAAAVFSLVAVLCGFYAGRSEAREIPASSLDSYLTDLLEDPFYTVEL